MNQHDLDPAIEAQRQQVLDALADGPRSARQLVDATGLGFYEIRRALQGLRRRGLVDPPLGEARKGAPGWKLGPQLYHRPGRTA